MRNKFSNWIRFGIVVVVISTTQTGCKSGWKMPGADMFSWSRKPSESTLTGSSPSLSMPSSSTPTSPATKSTPNALASSAAMGGRTPSYGPTSTGSNPYGPTGFGAGGPGAGLANNAMPGAGAASAANGYTTGPYQTASQTRPTGYTAPSGYGAPAGYGAPTGAPAGAIAGYGAPAGYGATAAAPSMPTNTGIAGYNPTSLPPAGATSYAPVGTTVPAQAASYGAPSGFPAPTGSSMPNAVAGGFPPATPAVQQQVYNGPSAYRPGSVGRNTQYDFSSQAPGAVASTPAAPGGFPPANSYPNTANGAPANPNSLYR